MKTDSSPAARQERKETPSSDATPLGRALGDYGERLIELAVETAHRDLPEHDRGSRLPRDCRHLLAILEHETPAAEIDGRARPQHLLRAAFALLSAALRLDTKAEAIPAEDRKLIRDGSRKLLAPLLLEITRQEAVRRDAVESRLRHDQQELEEAKVRLQRTIDHLTKLFEYSPDGIVTLDADGTVLTLNKAAKSITGYRASEIVGVKFISLLPDTRKARNLFKRLKKRWVSNYETVLRRKDGKDVPISVSASILESVDDNVTQSMMIFRDLSEVEEMKRQLIQSEQLAAMAKIAGAVAHEIRNPLNSLFLNTDLLEDEIGCNGAPMSDRAEHLLSVVREEIDRLNNIIVNYLSLSKVSALDPSQQELNSFLRTTAAEKAPEMEEGGVRLVEDYDDTIPPLFLDINQMRRVLFNLLQNSLNAMPEGGTITIKTRLDEKGTVEVVVKDTGVGIEKEHIQDIFNPFFSRLKGGTGLGLYLAREIIVAHHGTIALTSSKGKGTTVTLGLPLLDEWEER